MTGVRAQNRRATERSIEEAAVGLVGARGFDAVTGVEIAAAAGTTERTFFRYCASKVDAFLFVSRDVHDAVSAAVTGPVAFVALADVIAGVLGTFERDRPDDLDRLVRVRALLVADPALLSAVLERDAAQTLALHRAWGGADRFAVPLALLALRAAFDEWAERPAGESLSAAFRRTCAALRTATGS
ncbi:TetR family transcriptional regulator [Curtobacterium sp. VKM Ac-1393]|uniref:TetR family transcriptional regulator n=1 Tax=Curtobacterium sp. VKM Ac-1393 TaxID=2783814 RepID=UPI00188BE022|nr:TetR family transcriptional regulator [Curtobacterium sp. VKM Ac-1393]MBF4607483.1 TetR family transcriptional regulator [Curtobacterium sp. VKM Ac-1393]